MQLFMSLLFYLTVVRMLRGVVLYEASIPDGDFVMVVITVRCYSTQ